MEPLRVNGPVAPAGPGRGQRDLDLAPAGELVEIGASHPKPPARLERRQVSPADPAIGGHVVNLEPVRYLLHRQQLVVERGRSSVNHAAPLHPSVSLRATIAGRARQTGRMTRGASQADPVIAAEGVTKRYGAFEAVRGVDLEVARGTIFGFIGPSGSGKTVTVRLLTGSEQPTSGTSLVFGRPPAEFGAAERARMGYMPQLSVLYPHLSLQENLSFVASIYGLRRRERRDRMRWALDFVELGGHRRKRLRHTSGGMQRRLALAAALVHDPELLFLDEPTAGVDPVLRRKFWEQFEALRADGRTLFVTTQYVGEAAYCDQVGVITDGQLLTVDSVEGLRRRAYGGEILDLEARDRLEESTVAGLSGLDFVSGAERTSVDGRAVRVVVTEAGTAVPRLQRWLGDRGVRLESLQEHVPELDEVFVKLVEAARS